MRAILSLLLTLVFTSPAFGEELSLYAAAEVKSPVIEMAAEYEAATGHKVTCVFDTAGATEQRFRADPQATFLVTTQNLIGEGASAPSSWVGEMVGTLCRKGWQLVSLRVILKSCQFSESAVSVRLSSM